MSDSGCAGDVISIFHDHETDSLLIQVVEAEIKKKH